MTYPLAIQPEAEADLDARKARHAEFLNDTSEYQGVSHDFEVVQEFVVRKLSREQSLRSQLACDAHVMEAVELLFEKYVRLEMVIAGWIDQAVLEGHSCLRGDRRCWPKMLEELDVYRPDQNGDMCFYVADLDYNEVISTMISFEDSVISSKRYRLIASIHGGIR